MSDMTIIFLIPKAHTRWRGNLQVVSNGMDWYRIAPTGVVYSRSQLSVVICVAMFICVCHSHMRHDAVFKLC
jgi:hypothetical protein